MNDSELAESRGISTEQLEALRQLGLTDEAIEIMPDRALARSLEKVEIPDRAMLRCEHACVALLDDDGEFPEEAISVARRQLEEMRTAAGGSRKVAGVPSGKDQLPPGLVAMAATAGLNPDNSGWTALGPGNIGGRTRALVIDPGNPSRIFAGGVGGGVWVSFDAGAHWQATEDLMANLAVCCMVMDPQDPNTIYAGTGEGYSNSDALRGDGIFKTSDGWSWFPLEKTKKNKDFHFVNRLAVSSDGKTLLAATSTGIHRSTDSGATWKIGVVNGSIGTVVIDPNDDSKAIAGGAWNNKTYFSINGGASWSEAALNSPNAARTDVTYARKDSSIVYASVGVNLGRGNWSSEIWRSTDGGQTFTKRLGKPSNFLAKQGWYGNVIWAGDPTDSDLLLVGGVDLWRSTDGGDNLSPISTWWSPDSAHADQHAIVSDPGYDGTTNKRVYFGNDGGVYVTEDASTVGNNPRAPFTNGWKSLNNGYEVTQYFYGAGNTATKFIIGGAQDNGTLRYTPATGINDWNEVFGGDGGAVACDPHNPQVCYGEYVNLQIFRNTDGGATKAASEYICGSFFVRGRGWQWKPIPFSIPDAQNGKAQFIAPFVLDPNNSNRILGGGRSLWRTNDANTRNTRATGPRWAAIKPDIAAAWPTSERPQGNITAIAVAPADSDLILVGHRNGRIYKTIDGTAASPSWDRIDDNTAHGSSPINALRACLSLTIDPKNHQILFATFGGYQAGNIWKSSNGGDTWSDISERLPDAPIRAVTVHPQNSEWVYVATEVGIFASENGGADWSPTNEGPANVACHDFVWMDNTLVAVTHGRGMFQLDLTIRTQAEKILIGDMAGKIYAVDASSGAKTADQQLTDALTSRINVHKGTAYLGDAKAGVYSLDARSLAVSWSQKIPIDGSVDATPQLYKPPLSPDEFLLVSASNGHLYAMNAATGNPAWNIKVLDPAKVYSNFVMEDWAYLATEAGVYAVNLVTRSVAWSEPSISCQAPLMLAANMVFATSSDGTLHALDARSGESKWHVASGTGVASQTQPVWVLGAVIFGNTHGKVLGVNFRNGDQLFELTATGQEIKSLAADGNTVYFVGNAANGSLYAHDLTPSASGAWSTAEKWSPQKVRMGAARPAVVVGETLYLTTEGKQLLAFDTTDGSPRWELGTDHVPLASPAAVYAR